jgi:uncharacterized protein (DUF2147 family)
MKHHAIAAAMGVLTAAVFVPGSHASAADPTGYWVKPDSERNAKIQITKCGKGGAQLCSNIVWLENPNDSQGRPLHDIRNENPSMRDRPIQGLPLFTGMTRTGAATWTGKIYNPEDGNTYSATLTMVSNKQILLKGCKAWLLCGERQWLRTSAPPQPKTEEQLIEANAEPDEAEPAQPTQAAAAAIPSARPAPTNQSEPALTELVEETAEPEAAPEVELVSRVAAPSEHAVRPGYGFLSMASHTSPEKLSGESVPSMFTMADPIEADELAPQAAAPATASAPMPAAKPKAPQTTAAAQPQPVQAQPAQPGAAEAQAGNGQHAALAEPQEDAEPYQAVVTQPLTRKQKRALRRQQRQMLPWLQ